MSRDCIYAAAMVLGLLGTDCSSEGLGALAGTGGAGGSRSPEAVGGSESGGSRNSSTSNGTDERGGASESGGNNGTSQKGGNSGRSQTGGNDASGQKGGSDNPAEAGGRKHSGETGGSGDTNATGGRAGRGGSIARDAGPEKDAGSAKGGSTSSGSGGSSVSTADGGGTSAGCGAATVEPACTTKGTACSIDIKGTERTYFVQLPKDYDASKKYPLIFQYHPWGGSASQAMTMYNLPSAIPDAIYVSPQGLASGGSSPGWENSNGRDMDFTKAMIAKMEETYCVDTGRIFSVGFSYGGMMSYAIGCEMGDVFRAIAPMSGALYSGCKNGTHGIAMWGSHGTSDSVVPIADGRKGRDEILKRNHCGTETTPVDPSPCVSYQGCDEGYPVIWCEFSGDHGMPNFERTAVPAFLKQYL